jgi:hypothetical protein
MLKPELITKSQQVGIVQRKGYYNEDQKMTIEEEEGHKPMAKTHGQGFGSIQDPKRPNTANVFPNIPGKVIDFLLNFIEQVTS